MSLDRHKLQQACPSFEAAKITWVLDEVLTHPASGANQLFSKPTDAPTNTGPSGKKAGHDFFQRPLLSADRKSYWMLDRSLCALPCLEAVLGVLRTSHKDFDDRLGTPIETFVREQFAAHNVPTLTGNYRVDGEEGECDIVVETSEAIIFLEIKKKPLTRRAQAGSDAHVLLDLANSLLAAQVQAGWHEVRLRKHGFLELDDRGVRTRLDLRGRAIERIAVSLMQFGGFQDRVLLKQFLEGTLHADFSVNEPSLQNAFAKFNGLLRELREQVNQLHPGEATLNQPFFHCWFLSVPQLLVLFDDVESPDALKQALWKTRSLVTGSADFYYDFAWMQRAAESNATKPVS